MLRALLMPKLTVNDVDLHGQRVFVRVDYNVPMEEAGGTMIINDETRIRATLPTLASLREQGARMVLAAHLGEIRLGQLRCGALTKLVRCDPLLLEQMRNDLRQIDGGTDVQVAGQRRLEDRAVLVDAVLDDSGEMLVPPDVDGPGRLNQPQGFVAALLGPTVAVQIGDEALQVTAMMGRHAGKNRLGKSHFHVCPTPVLSPAAEEFKLPGPQ